MSKSCIVCFKKHQHQIKKIDEVLQRVYFKYGKTEIFKKLKYLKTEMDWSWTMLDLLKASTSVPIHSNQRVRGYIVI